MLIKPRIPRPESQRPAAGRWRCLAAGCALLVAAACAPAPQAPPRATAQPLPEQTARFAVRPDAIFTALQEACTAPNQRLTRPDRDVLECRMLLPPAPTASAILRYGGTIEHLPELVIRLRLQEDATGLTLGAAQYLDVPQQSGGSVRVVYPDDVLDRRLREILRDLGGETDT